MDRLKGVGSFVLITIALLLALRGAHSFVGVAYPKALPGPFELASLDEVEQYAGFWPHIPFYRPMSLGTEPREVVAERRPHPKVRVIWSDESFLELIEASRADRPAVDPAAQPLPGHPQALYWTSGGELIAVLPVADRWLRVRTDLDLTELRRIIDTLLRYDRLL